MSRAPQDDEDLEWLQDKYREHGFIVVACNYPKEIGQTLILEDTFIDPGVRWRVIAESNRTELTVQLRNITNAVNRPYFYRVEAMD